MSNQAMQAQRMMIFEPVISDVSTYWNTVRWHWYELCAVVGG